MRLLLPMVFTPPATVRGLIGGTDAVTSATELGKNVPIVWG